MKKLNFSLWNRILLYFIIIPLFFISCQNDEGSLEIQEIEALVGYDIEPIEGQYIIVLHGESTAKKANAKYSEMKSSSLNELSSKFAKIQLSKESVVQSYGYALHGFAAKLTDDQLNALQKDSRVKYIEKDYLISLGKPKWAGGGGGGSTAQETPWGITRVNGVSSYAGGKTAWIIDTGIDLTHPDLNVDSGRSISVLGGKDKNDPNDANGHGTHVAGTIAAINNDIGVIGVAPGATVVSVRVLNRRGSGSYSGVIAGVDYVGANGANGDVANMSLGGPVSKALDDAVIAASTVVKFCLAAGNDGDNANNHSPARVNGSNIYTISASDSKNNFASWSNWGNPPVDFCAPGVSIKSTWKKGEYNTISGTSMATPHAAGVLLLGSISNNLTTADGDPDGNPDEIISH